MEDLLIINNKLKKDLYLRQIFSLPLLLILFLLSLLGLVPKHDIGFWYIYYLSYLKDRLVNNNISDGVGEPKYIKFQEVFNLILKAKRYCIIIKRNIKDVF